ncbi:MAG: hypothetical protein V4507_08820 [Verrucomicrobiota bacterium]
MIICMRTTLVIDDPIFMKAKKFALEHGVTLGALTSQALQEHIQRHLEPRRTEKFLMPLFGGSTHVAHSPQEIAQFRDEGRS